MFKHIFTLVSWLLFLILAVVSTYLFGQITNKNYFDTSFSSIYSSLENTQDRAFYLSIKRENEIYLVLGGDEHSYEKIRSTIEKLHNIDGISWFYTSKEPTFLDFYKRESYYRNPKITRVSNKEELLSRLQKYVAPLSKEEKLKVAKSDPLGFGFEYYMPPYTISEDNLLYVNAHSDACGSEKKCYILQGIIDDKFLHEGFNLFSSNRSNVVKTFNSIIDDFKAQGGVVFCVGGILDQSTLIDLIRNEISFLWLISLGIILILFLVVFKRIRPFISFTIGLCLSLAIGFMLTVYFCGSVHLLTFILIAPIIAILSDLFLNYMAEHSSKNVKYRVAFLCLIITIIMYSSLALSGLMLFVQLAVFAVITTFVFFLYIYAFLPLLKPLKDEVTFRHINLININRKSIVIRLFSFLCFLFIIFCAFMGYSNFISVKNFELPVTSEMGIIENAQNLKALLFNGKTMRTLIVSGDTIQSLAQRVNSLNEYLEGLKKEKKVSYFFTYKDTLIPSDEAKENIDFYESLLPVARDFYGKNGFTKEELEKIKIPHFKRVPTFEFSKIETIKSYQEVLDISDIPYLSVATLSGISDADLVTLQEKLPFVEYRDFEEEYKDLIIQHRDDTLIVIALLFLCLIMMIFTFSGLNGSLGIILPSILGIGVSISFMDYMHIALSLYSICAIILILGVSIDFSLFIRQLPKLMDRRSIQTAIVAFILNISLFSILALSDLPNISNMGKIICVGLVTSTLGAVFLNLFIIPPKKTLKGSKLFYSFKGKKSLEELSNKAQDKEVSKYSNHESLQNSESDEASKNSNKNINNES